jgi:hypothetical protein
MPAAMSFRVINDVTRALGTLIESQVRLTIPAAEVTLLPPGDTLPEKTGVNLYLYRIQESPFTRNDPWPGTRTRPPSTQPALGLQLHYLLTPLGKASEGNAQVGDVAHTVLGIAMLTLHENPILNRTHVNGFDADVSLSDYLLNCYDEVKVTLSSISVEDLSKIWATINQPYRLSVAYEVSVIELVAEVMPRLPAGVVQHTDVDVFLLEPPRLTGLQPAQGALARLDAGELTANELTVRGSGLGRLGAPPTVRVGGAVAGLAAPVEDPFDTLTAVLPTNLDAGPQVDVRVSTAGATSEAVTFTVSPWLASITPIRTALDAVSPAVVLAGHGLTASPRVRFAGPGGVRTTDAVQTGGELRAPIPDDLSNGLYDVRAQLGGGTQLSNGRTLEVIPELEPTPSVTVVGGKQQLEVTGARLAGDQIVLIVDDVARVGPPNADATALSFTFQRPLAAGEHTMAVAVDESRSHTVSFRVS